MMSESNAQEIEFRSGPAAAAAASPKSRFQLDDDSSTDAHPLEESCDTLSDASGDRLAAIRAAHSKPGGGGESEIAQQAARDIETDAWRQELATRLTRYRSRRRPRQTRYPSLLLKFECEPPARQEVSAASPPIADALARAIPVDEPPEIEPVEPEATIPLPSLASVESPAPETGRLLEFPRPALPPPRPWDELASPVIERPRIFEVPEIEPPAPALGGISIETELDTEEKRPGFEIPLLAAPLGRRVVAAAVDAALILVALGLFVLNFFRVTHAIPSVKDAALWGTGLAGFFWAVYEYAFLVYTGSTPGIRIAKLQLSRFDGRAVPRKMRRWRALASILSAASLGLGLAWCFLDEDQLCWHDRITRTYIAPGPQPS